MKPIGNNLIVTRVPDVDITDNGLILPNNLFKEYPLAPHVILELSQSVPFIQNNKAGLLPGDVVFCAKTVGVDFDYVDEIGKKRKAKMVDYNYVIAHIKCQRTLDKGVLSERKLEPARDIVLLKLKPKPEYIDNIQLVVNDDDFMGGTYSTRELWENEAEVLAVGPGYFDVDVGEFVETRDVVRVGETVRIPRFIPKKWCLNYKQQIIAYVGIMDLWCKNG